MSFWNNPCVTVIQKMNTCIENDLELDDTCVKHSIFRPGLSLPGNPWEVKTQEKGNNPEPSLTIFFKSFVSKTDNKIP